MQWYKNQVAYIPEDVEVLNSSILNNILISNPDLNEQEVSRLLQNVGLDKELKKRENELMYLIVAALFLTCFCAGFSVVASPAVSDCLSRAEKAHTQNIL